MRSDFPRIRGAVTRGLTPRSVKKFSKVRNHFSGFSGLTISPEDPDALERLARSITRPPLALGSVSLTPDGQILISTLSGHRIGEESKILDPLE
jgi:hypothetical protein